MGSNDSGSSVAGPVRSHLDMFHRILHDAQSSKLHTWSNLALQRAWDWALYLQQQAPPPSTTSTTAAQLRSAPRDVLTAVVTSPFLLTHPSRLELLHSVCDLYRRVDDPGHALASDIVHWLEEQATTDTLFDLAHALGDALPCMHITLAHHTLRYPALEHWQLQRRTLQVAALATSFQHQLLATTKSHDECRAIVSAFFNTASSANNKSSLEKDIVVYAALVLAWPPTATQTHNDLADGLASLLTTHVAQLLDLSPWLAARFCQQHPAVAQEYVAALVAHALARKADEADAHETSVRLGTLVHGHDQLHAACEASLAALAPSILHKLVSPPVL
ncbi:hypothetical protein SPRG_08096 [Saprolegnia parasitica CBS 223.65]|uniref:Uncharacterized protein n=1 Tax=Saprolegnia parasitica (strain CBS 223.65) TaxID=695850 RepID=A0A067CJU7_SAPPC|nr:hypothetical protein SPRG_08096 [Saprolegnia parasitica CBS 223.65]KDO26806.1 hypothetical protein SPRG_08096 [Saprolegnia parasitica CBS 223.65]|eukprot:XP_012202454.1 hypothetical protein SPRG_08096 [Saprolegnia parasitica CBS 223.65]